MNVEIRYFENSPLIGGGRLVGEDMTGGRLEIVAVMVWLWYGYGMVMVWLWLFVMLL
jgi:hypothetical protein